MQAPSRFPIRYSPWLHPLFAGLGMGPRFSGEELTPDELRVRMEWAFEARVPRSSIQRAALGPRTPCAIGVHSNLRFTTWLINGAASGVVVLDIDPPARGRFAFMPLRRIERLGIAVEDPDGFLKALGASWA